MYESETTTNSERERA